MFDIQHFFYGKKTVVALPREGVRFLNWASLKICVVLERDTWSLRMF